MPLLRFHSSNECWVGGGDFEPKDSKRCEATSGSLFSAARKEHHNTVYGVVKTFEV